ncbi:hypothetical protein [Shewanella algae]|uniref:Tubulin/FtsZ GTPase domain-containing protein n=1 Tax=Shewanella algae TaxID=38313 RepID=A0A7T8E996_9GAMM|nr:hypothetical protein D7032_01965 [Shewanella algae]
MTEPTLLDNEPVFLIADSEGLTTDSLSNAIYVPQILVIGVGDLGCYIGASLLKQQFDRLSGLLVSRKPNLLSVIDCADTLLVHTDAETPFDEDGIYCARLLIEKADLVLLVGALGGSSDAPLVSLAEYCNRLNVPVVGTVVLPFAFEGKPKNNKANEALLTLNSICNGMLVLPNDRLKLALSPNTSAFDALNAGNLFISELLRDLLQVLGQTGLINLDFNDFITFIRDARTLAPFRVSFSNGEIDWTSLIANQFKSSLLADVRLETVTSALVHFSVSADFSLGLMHEFLDALYETCPKLQQVLSGVTVMQADTGKLKVLLITSSARL